ncbi:enoyl-CoA hydratase/isomerase family protein [Specibacter sp. RAF43]|uniref:enoyl-CoA hydratase/isomerase family protein n=1 Tax=Specibacter sp. RAF43 TaxID=3233057 RepID=UPI003F9C5A30
MTSHELSVAGVAVTVTDSVARIVLDRPDRANAIDLDTAARLRQVLAEIGEDSAVSVVVLAANGRTFCAGGDLSAMLDPDSADQYLRRAADEMGGAVLDLLSMPQPVVASVSGSVAGAGLGLVLASDVVIAQNGAKFVGAYGAVGLTPDCGVSVLLPRKVGPGLASDMLLTGRVLTATEACSVGLVNRVVPLEELPRAVDDVVTRLAHVPTHAVRRTKALLSGDLDEVARAIDLESAAIAEAVIHPESKALIEQFLDTTYASSRRHREASGTLTEIGR